MYLMFYLFFKASITQHRGTSKWHRRACRVFELEREKGIKQSSFQNVTAETWHPFFLTEALLVE